MDWLFAEVPGDRVWFYLEGNTECRPGSRRGFVFTDFRIAMDHIRTHGWTEVWLHLYVPRGTPTTDGKRFLLVQSVFELPGHTGYVYVTECGQVFADHDIRVERYMTTNLKLVFQPT